jgi:hypothetical protein
MMATHEPEPVANLQPRILSYRLRKDGKPHRHSTSFPVDEVGVGRSVPDLDHGPIRLKIRIATACQELTLTEDQARALARELVNKASEIAKPAPPAATRSRIILPGENPGN